MSKDKIISNGIEISPGIVLYYENAEDFADAFPGMSTMMAAIGSQKNKSNQKSLKMEFIKDEINIFKEDM